MALVRPLQRLAGPLLHRLPPLARMHRQRKLPELAPRSFQQLWRHRSPR
jgi:hypothetical protein